MKRILIALVLSTIFSLCRFTFATDENNYQHLPFEAKLIYQKYLLAENELNEKLIKSLQIQADSYERKGNIAAANVVQEFLDERISTNKEEFIKRMTANIKSDEKFVRFRKGMQFALDHPAPFTIVPDEFAGKKISIRNNQISQKNNEIAFTVSSAGDVYIMVPRDHLVPFEANDWEYITDAEYEAATPVKTVILRKFYKIGNYKLPSLGH
ncbi:MAG: hypothetical protein ACJZ86_03190, partial [Pontiellaceae bacterium]